MHSIQTLFLTLALASAAQTQPPAGFTWINPQSDQTVMPIVRKALQDQHLSVFQKVGVEDGYALVLAQSKDDPLSLDGEDRWKIASVSLATGKSTLLVAGFQVKILAWLAASQLAASQNELAIQYLDCWGCEPTTIFTTFRLVKDKGWQARWPQSEVDPNDPEPGAELIYPEEGGSDPLDRQVYAIVKQSGGSFAIGNWRHSRNIKGRFDDDLLKYSIDPTTGEETAARLDGKAAEDWKRELCNPANIVLPPHAGQNFKLCLALVHAPAATHPPRVP